MTQQLETPTQLRPSQEAILDYEGGYMGISAVPGAGKTFTLSLLAAELVTRLAEENRLGDQEVLVVTFTNSAAENFRNRINQFISQRGLLPGSGYRVRTLHGLAHDIVRERPGLVGLSEEFTIVDDRTTGNILETAVNAYLSSHPDLFGGFLKPEFLENPRRIERYISADAMEMARSTIRVVKESGATPASLRAALAKQSGYWPLLNFAIDIYESYAKGLQVRGGVDFDDLIVLALEALNSDPDFLARLQTRWPYVLEDEAQDSSLLQEKMLGLLTDSHHNWVRVGDPNQAINTTFTSADPRFLRRFVTRPDVADRPLPASGRSALPIIDVANFLAEWSRTQHPVLPEEMALTRPDIQPTQPGDPQPNPAPGDPCVTVYDQPLNPEDELRVLMLSLKRWLPKNQEKSVAVLVPDNGRGFNVIQALEKTDLLYDDTLLRSSKSTRAAADALATILQYISRPEVPTHLKTLWENVWWPRKGRPMIMGDDPAPKDEELPEPVATFGRALQRANLPETFLFPRGGEDWLEGLPWLEEAEGFRPVAEAFRADLRRWTSATVLPVDELVLTLGNALFSEPADLALTHSIAVLLAKRAREMPHLRLPDLAQMLVDISQNQGRLLGFDDTAVGFEPPKGVISVGTMHAAKGLEWDRVYLLAVSDYSFPSGGDESGYRGERWFVRENLNLQAELEAQLRQLHMGTLDEYESGAASLQTRLDVAAERLRLLYVGITRARQELIVLYNTGRFSDTRPNEPAVAFKAMAEYLGGDDTKKR